MKYKIIFLISVVFFFVAGYFTCYILNKNKNAQVKEQVYNDCMQTTKERLSDSGVLNITELNPAVNRSIVGTIKSISNNVITVSIKPLKILADVELDERIIKINEQTSLIKITEKNEADYQKELDSFHKNHPEFLNIGETVEGAPARIAESQIEFSDLKIGGQVVVETENDITNVKEFLAKKLIVSE